VAGLFYTLLESGKLAGVEPAACLAAATRRAIATPGTVTPPRELASGSPADRYSPVRFTPNRNGRVGFPYPRRNWLDVDSVLLTPSFGSWPPTVHPVLRIRDGRVR
jgi:hypothetical protein